MTLKVEIDNDVLTQAIGASGSITPDLEPSLPTSRTWRRNSGVWRGRG